MVWALSKGLLLSGLIISCVDCKKGITAFCFNLCMLENHTDICDDGPKKKSICG